jgi:hypothetical protein
MEDNIMPNANPEDYFPELNIHLIKMQAERWVKKYSKAPIKRILLYNFSSKYEGTIIALHGSLPNITIYAIVFELDDYYKPMNMSTEQHLQYDLEGIRGERNHESYERLLAATKSNCTIADNEQYHDFMTRDFAKVYKTPPNSDYRKEWKFHCNFKNTWLSASVRTDEPHIVLWPLERAETIQKWAKTARHNGHIDILKLCHILAFDQESSTALPALWQAYEIEKSPYPMKTAIFTERVGAWFKLMNLWTTGYNGIRYNNDITCIKTGFCEGGNYVDDPANKGNRVNLQTLKDYFTDTLLTPPLLPQILFPDDLIDDSESAAINKTDYYFILKGDYWDVGFAGETSTLKDLKGLRTVVVLLKNPNHEFYPLELQQVVEGLNEDLSDEDRETRDNYTDLSQGKDENGISLLQKKEHLSLNAMPIERLFEDEEERERFEKMINEVWERTTGNDSTEWGQLKEYLLNEKGVRLWYTPRGPVYKYLGRLNDDSENARKAISKNINGFKKKIKDKKMPSLLDHLNIYITTGNKISYTADPTTPINWKIKD